MPILDVKKDVSYCVGSFGEGLDHPECVTWGSDGYAYAGGEGGQLYRINVTENKYEQFPRPRILWEACVKTVRGTYIFVVATKFIKPIRKGR